MRRKALCPWCDEPRRNMVYGGKLQVRCGCHRDLRTPVEVRRDAVIEKYGDDPAAYTPPVLRELAEQGLFDIAAAFCPAGRLTIAEARAREAACIIASCDSGSDPKGENSRSEVEGEASQSGAAKTAHRPETTSLNQDPQS